MKCYNHPQKNAIGNCSSCFKGICEECAVTTEGRLVCRECLASRPKKNAKDPTAAFLMELVGGFLGFLGIGWMYADEIGKGFALLVGYWIFLAIETLFIIPILGVITLGLGCCLYSFIPIQGLIFGLVSGESVKNKLRGRT